MVLSNEGRVPFDFCVDLSRLSRPGVVEASPLKGAVAGGEKQVRVGSGLSQLCHAGRPSRAGC